MRRSRRVRTCLAVLVTVSFASAPGAAQDHEAHHAGQNANTAPAAPAGREPGPSPAPGPMAPGDGGMERMMEGMGAPPPKELYPSLMEAPELSPERREEVARLAAERMAAGRERMAGALGRLSDASARGDATAMQQASADLREALSEFESGLAAQRALAEGAAPREVALEWFKRETNLLPPQSAAAPHGLFGLSWFHYVVMGILAAFAVAVVGIYLHKMRRAEALVARLAASAPVPAAAAPLSAAAGTSVAAAKWSGRLRVARVFQETPDVKTFRLVDPDRSEFLPFTFDPGQFLTVSVRVDGKDLKRSYSLSSSPACQGWCEITVKHAPGGRVSGHLDERVREGDLLQVSGPSGRFTFRGQEAASVVFVAGGVGITPLMSSIRYLTDQSWPGEIFLVYGCASRKDIIFHDELEHLQKRHPNLHVTIALDEEDSLEWAGPRGYVTKELLLGAVPGLAARRVHVCGPPPMMEAVRASLAEIGVPTEQIKTEAFLTPEPRRAPAPVAPAADPAAARSPVCTFARSRTSAPLPPDTTVLEAAESVGVEIDNSCREGYCGVCKTKLLAGRVTMAVEDALDDDDRAQEFILACQARSTGDVTVDA